MGRKDSGIEILNIKNVFFFFIHVILLIIVFQGFLSFVQNELNLHEVQ